MQALPRRSLGNRSAQAGSKSVVLVEGFQAFHDPELVGVFENDYTGGDFCAGLKFGFSGSNLLFSIAETIVHTTVKTMKANAK